MTAHWWDKDAWGRGTVKLATHLRDAVEGHGGAEFVFGDATSASHFGYSNGWTQNPSLTPPGRLFVETQAELGDFLTARPDYKAWYQSDTLTASSSPFERWSYNYTNAHDRFQFTLPANINPELVLPTSFRFRASHLAQYCDWSVEEARTIANANPKRNSDTLPDSWGERLVAEKTSSDASWHPLLANQYLPSGDTYDLYVSMVQAMMDSFNYAGHDNRAVRETFGFLTKNPNIPSELLLKAESLVEPVKSRSEFSDGRYDVILYRIRSHPNFPGSDHSEGREDWTSLSDGELFDAFRLSDRDHSRIGFFAAEALRNPKREAVLRDILAASFGASGYDNPLFSVAHENLALLLPAASAVLGEISEGLGETAEDVPFEWLLALAS